MAELKLSGNHLKGSRPVLSFSKVTAETPNNWFTASSVLTSSCEAMSLYQSAVRPGKQSELQCMLCNGLTAQCISSLSHTMALVTSVLFPPPG